MTREVGSTKEVMDGRGGGDNGSATLTVKGSRQGGMKRCGQSRHQGTSDKMTSKVTGDKLT